MKRTRKPTAIQSFAGLVTQATTGRTLLLCSTVDSARPTGGSAAFFTDRLFRCLLLVVRDAIFTVDDDNVVGASKPRRTEGQGPEGEHRNHNGSSKSEQASRCYVSKNL